jgi:hypothetical protein
MYSMFGRTIRIQSMNLLICQMYKILKDLDYYDMAYTERSWQRCELNDNKYGFYIS